MEAFVDLKEHAIPASNSAWLVNQPPPNRGPPQEIAGVPYDQGLWKPLVFPKKKSGRIF